MTHVDEYDDGHAAGYKAGLARGRREAAPLLSVLRAVAKCDAGCPSCRAEVLKAITDYKVRIRRKGKGRRSK